MKKDYYKEILYCLLITMLAYVKRYLVNLTCKIFGHKWNPKWHCHNRYYGLTCERCGKKAGKK